jgi:hypothetical protein
MMLSSGTDYEHSSTASVSTGSSSNSVKIFRFEFSEDFKSELRDFANIHRHDSCEDFKEAWDEWRKEHVDDYDAERERLEALGYSGKFDDKTYTAVRYYFRNRGGNGSRRKEATTRRSYVSLGDDILTKVDEHLRREMTTETFTPAVGYKLFSEEHYYDIEKLLSQHGEDTPAQKQIEARLKKTYKNRYFLMNRRVTE